MKHLKHQVWTLLLVLVCVVYLPVTAEAATSIQTIRVGLNYDSTTLLSANLANERGSGYRFGYYSNGTNFVQLGQTSEGSITMVATTNVYLNGSDFSNSSSAGAALGCYHVVHSTGYQSYEAAKTAAAELSSGFVAWISGEYQVRSGAFTNSADAQTHAAAIGGNVAGTTGYGINIVKTGTTELIFQFDSAGNSPMAVEPDTTGNSDPQTWFKNIVYRGGFQYERVGQGNLVVTNHVDIDPYVKGVIPYEMSASWPLETLKTQAVCARTYGVLAANQVRHKSENFDICNTAHCQVYYGMGGPNTRAPGEVSDQAVDETSNMFLFIGNKLAETYYSSSHGGASEAVSNVWRSSSQSSYPHLGGVIDPYEQLAASLNSRSSWTVSFTKSELQSMLQGKGLGVGAQLSEVQSIYSPTGNVKELVIHWDNGKTSTLYPADMRGSTWLALPAIHFTVNEALPAIVETSAGSIVGTTTPSTGTGSSYLINGSDTVSTLKGLYTISAGALLSKIVGNNYMITGTGDLEALGEPAITTTPTLTGAAGVYSPNILTGSRTTSGDSYTFYGSGWGHNIGMSQFGAYAMAKYKNFTYDFILEFYFPGTEVRHG